MKGDVDYWKTISRPGIASHKNREKKCISVRFGSETGDEIGKTVAFKDAAYQRDSREKCNRNSLIQTDLDKGKNKNAGQCADTKIQQRSSAA